MSGGAAITMAGASARTVGTALQLTRVLLTKNGMEPRMPGRCERAVDTTPLAKG